MIKGNRLFGENLSIHSKAFFRCFSLEFIGSLPSTITKGQKYPFEKEIKLDGVTKLDSYRVTAMVINNKTGLIENAININGLKYNGIVNTASENQSLKVITLPGTIYVSSADGLAYVYSILTCRTDENNQRRVELFTVSLK